MKRFLGIAIIFFVAAAGWKIGENLSPDAIGIALGVIFGMMAGIPAALIALAANRTQRVEHVHRYEIPQPPIAALPASVSVPMPVVRNVESNVIVLPGTSQKRIGANR